MPNIVEIPLGRGRVAIIDAADVERVSRHRWYLHVSQYNGRRPKFYARTQSTPKLFLHRVLKNAGLYEIVDHRDGDGLNCRDENLRVTNTRNNNFNRVRYGLFKGVSRCGNAWRARITIDGRATHLGQFATPEEAALAYDTAARQLFGEFACLNFPDGAVPLIETDDDIFDSFLNS